MVSRRLMSVPESGTVKISNMVSGMRSQGIDALSFSLGEPDFTTPQNIIDAAKGALDDGFTHYTPSRGISPLREAIARKSRDENGIDCSIENVLVTPTKQAIFLTCLAFLDEGDEVILPDPSWVTYEACIRLTGAKPVFVPLSADDGYRLTPESVSEAITPRTKMVLTNSPSNPCGGVMSRSDVVGIADLAKDHDMMVMADEVYEKILYEGEHVSMASIDGMMDRTITVHGLSKSYAMTGWRVGWILASKANVDSINKLQTHSITCVTSFAQVAAVEALNGPQDSVEAMVREFRARRDLVCDLIDGIDGLSAPRPEGAFYAFPEYDADMSSQEFATLLLEKARVAVTPGSAFGPSGEGKFRLSYAASRENIIEGMGRIEKVLSEL